MAITTLGYEGAINDIAYSKRSRFEGAQFPVVADRSDFAVTIAVGADRTVNVAPGVACAHAIMATSDAVTTVQSTAVTTPGATRWDAIVLRFNWSANSAVLTKVEGTAGASAPQVLPPGLKVVVGEEFDQILALVRIAQGQTTPTAVVDMRCWASKVFLAPSLSAFPPSSSPYGSEIVVGGVRYRSDINSSGSPAWIPIQSGSQVTNSFFSSSTPAGGTGFTYGGLTIRAVWNEVTGDVQLELQHRRTGATVTPNSTGNFSPDLPIGTVSLSYLRPDLPIPISGQYRAASSAWYPWSGVMNPDGVVSIYSGAAGVPLAQFLTAGDISLRTFIRFTREV